LKVDKRILVLGVFYILTLIAYLFFEDVVINYRPVLIEGVLEASYPSSTTLLTMCVMPTAALQLRSRIQNPGLRTALIAAIWLFTALMVLGRLICGVHWFSDIVGGALLSAGLVSLYRAAANV
jgi:undecaprenyl-diphosphatase